MPAWFFFALLSALGSAGATLVGKKTLMHERPIEFSTIFSVLIFLCSLPLLYWADLSRMSGLWLVLYAGSWFGTTGFLLVITALKNLGVSIVSPLTNLNAMFTAILAFLVLGERVSSLQYVGIGLLVLGLYLFDRDVHRESHTKKSIEKREFYMLLVLLSGLSYSMSSLVDKYVLSRIDVATYLVVAQGFISLNFLLISLLRGVSPISLVSKGCRDARLFALFVGATLFYRGMQAIAVSMAPVTLVVPIKRTSSIISTIAAGRVFRERNIRRKIIYGIIMVIGATLVITG